jgi:WD40 repeat protein
MSQTQAPSSPYKGLSAFEDSELDALLFFGREREKEIVVANLIASRLTVLYGPSGVGKSSLLRASVARSLRELPEEPLVVVFSRWSENPEAALAEAVAEAGGGRNGSTVAALQHAQSERDVYLVLDQAEEYFLYHGDESGPGTFAEALPSILAAPYRVNVLVSLREDSLAKLDRFTGRIPGLFANTLRLDRLDRAAAEAAILRPVDRFNALTASHVVVEAGLVARVLEEVGSGRIEPALGGLGGVEAVADLARVEAPYLQLVMQRLWEEEQSLGSDTLRVETLDRLGGARQIVEEHLDGAMAELSPAQQDVAARIFNHLVTPSGTKIAHELPDLVDFSDVPAAELQPVLSSLAGRRILRSLEEGEATRYEIFHDVLAQPMLAWRAGHEAEREIEREREAADRRHRRLLAVIAVGAVLLAAMSAVTAYALSQRSEAREQAARALTEQQNAEAQKAIADAQRQEAEAQKLEAEAQKREADKLRVQAEQNALAAVAAQDAAEQSEAEALAAQEEAQQNADDADAAQQEAEENEAEALAAEAKAKQSEAAARVAEENAEDEARKAESAEAVARARAKAQRSLRLAAIRPLEALRLAVEAAQAAPDSSLAENVLRSALASSRATAVLPGGGGPLSSAQLSPDGRQALTIASRARLFDARSGAPIRTLGEEVETTSGGFSPDGRVVVTGAADGTVRLWSVAGESSLLLGSAPRVLRGHTKRVHDTAFSPDGSLVATASADRTVIVWSMRNGEQVRTLRHAGRVQHVRFSADGHLVVTVSERPVPGSVPRLLANVFDVRSGELVLPVSQFGIRSAVFSPDGNAVVTTSNDNTARVWSLNGTLLGRLDQDEDVISAAFNPDGSRLVTATEGGSAYVWNTSTWTREYVITGPLNPLTGASFSPDGRLIVVSSGDRTVRVHQARLGLLKGVIGGHADSVVSATFAPDSNTLLTASLDGSARIWDTGAGDLLRQVGPTQDKPVQRAEFSPDGKLAVSAGADGTARILDVARGRQLEVLRHEAAVNSAEFDPTGRIVVTASDDGRARIWRTDGQLLQVLPHGDRVLRALFTPRGGLVVTAGVDDTVAVWRARDGKIVHRLRGHEDDVLDLAVSPDGTTIASAGDNGDRTVRVWRGGRVFHVLRHDGPVVRVAFSPNGRLLVTASGDELARLWRVDTGELVHTFRGHTEFVQDAEFSADGQYVVTASDDRDAAIWSVATGLREKTLRGHFRGPSAAVFSPNGRWVLTTGRTAVGLWDLSTGRFFAPTGLVGDPFLRGHASDVSLTGATFSPNGKRILSTSADGTVRTYFCDLCGRTPELLRIARSRLEALGDDLSPAEQKRYLRG